MRAKLRGFLCSEEAFLERDLRLFRMDGEDLARPVNSDFVKKILCMMYLVFFPHQYSEVWP
jgi:hypothetical protein